MFRCRFVWWWVTQCYRCFQRAVRITAARSHASSAVTSVPMSIMPVREFDQTLPWWPQFNVQYRDRSESVRKTLKFTEMYESFWRTSTGGGLYISAANLV